MNQKVFYTDNLTNKSELGKDKKPIWLRSPLIASWFEIILMLSAVLGYFIYASTAVALHKLTGHSIGPGPVSNPWLHAIAEESTILALMLAYLYWRGWITSDFKIRISIRSSLQGIFLLFGWVAIFFGVTTIAFILQMKYGHPDVPHTARGSYLRSNPIDLSWRVLIVYHILNDYFEELVFMGYAFNQFAAKRGPIFALFATVLLRIACHTWKDPWFIFETGIQFTVACLCYWRVRNLWPLIVAHGFFDLLTIVALKFK